MRLELSEAISLIIALPAHRSHNENHRKMGEKAFDFLFEYKDLGKDNTEKAFNRAMIGSILSAVRMFSIERDRINSEWKAIEAIKVRRERLLVVIKNISPFEKGNYWSKIISLLIALGYSFSKGGFNIQNIIPISIFSLVVALIGLEIISKILEFLGANYFEKRLPIEREKKWRSESIEKYEVILENFIDKAVSHYNYYYPDESKIYGYKLDKKEDLKKLKEHLLKKHFFL